MISDHAPEPIQPISLSEWEHLCALAVGGILMLLGAWQRSVLGAGLILISAPLLYRGVVGTWPSGMPRWMLRGLGVLSLSRRDVHVWETMRLNVPVADLFAFWRQLDHLPAAMAGLTSVGAVSDRHSHWVARGPLGLSVEWDAAIVDEVPRKMIVWRSLPGSEIRTSGSVHFDDAGGDSTYVTVHLQYEAPAGQLGVRLARLVAYDTGEQVRANLRQLEAHLTKQPQAQYDRTPWLVPAHIPQMPTMSSVSRVHGRTT